MTNNAKERFLKDRRGNFGLMTALVFPVLLATGGVAMDLTKMVMTKSELQDATDSAALAAASALANDGVTAEEARLIALRFLKTQIGGGSAVEDNGKKKDELDSATTVTVTETALLGNGKSFTVDVSLDRLVEFNPFTRLLGQTSTTMTAKSSAESATESKNAMSMFVVLDKSGSMGWITTEEDKSVSSCYNPTEKNQNPKYQSSPCYIRKIAALKLAAASLFTQLKVADPTSTYVRTAAIAYDGNTYDPTKLEWGVADAADYVNALNAGGMTSSTGAMKKAYKNVKKASESTAHKNKNGQEPTRYIVFMTDGDNNNDSDDTKTKAICDDARDDGIEVYTVAFMAPEGGQNLLKACATDASHYFQAENMTALVEAFKVIGERTSAVVSRLTK